MRRAVEVNTAALGRLDTGAGNVEGRLIRLHDINSCDGGSGGEEMRQIRRNGDDVLPIYWWLAEPNEMVTVATIAGGALGARVYFLDTPEVLG